MTRPAFGSRVRFLRGALLALTLTAAAFAASLAGGPLIGGGGGSSTAEASGALNPTAALNCSRVADSGLALCRLTTSQQLQIGDQISFSASTSDGAQRSLSLEYNGKVGFRPAPFCHGPEGCYIVSFQLGDTAADDVAVDGLTLTSTASVDSANVPNALSVGSQSDPPQQLQDQQQSTDTQQSELTEQTLQGSSSDSTVIDRPSGDGVVNVTFNGDVQVDTTTYTPPLYPKTSEEADKVQELTDDVKEQPSGTTVVVGITKSKKGDENHEADWENQKKVEDALWERGEPYTVCDPARSGRYFSEHKQEWVEWSVEEVCFVVTPE